MTIINLIYKTVRKKNNDYYLGDFLFNEGLLTKEKLQEAIEKVDLKAIDSEGLTPLLSLIKNHNDLDCPLSNLQWEYLIKNSDLNAVDKNQQNALMNFFILNHENNIDWPQNLFEYMVYNTNLSQIDIFGNNIFFIAIRFEKKGNYTLSFEIIEHLLDFTNLKHKNHLGWDAFKLACAFSPPLTESQWNRLIGAIESPHYYENFLYALMEKVPLTQIQWTQLIENSAPYNRQLDFQNLPQTIYLNEPKFLDHFEQNGRVLDILSLLIKHFATTGKCILHEHNIKFLLNKIFAEESFNICLSIVDKKTFQFIWKHLEFVHQEKLWAFIEERKFTKEKFNYYFCYDMIAQTPQYHMFPIEKEKRDMQRIIIEKPEKRTKFKL